jgi:hypothetical protein
MRRGTKSSCSIERDPISPDRQYGRGLHALKGDTPAAILSCIISSGLEVAQTYRKPDVLSSVSFLILGKDRYDA